YSSTSSTVSTAGTPIATLTGKTSYLDQGASNVGLVPNTTYYYKVVAADDYGNVSTDSNLSSNKTVADTTPPSFPGNNSGLTMASHTISQIMLSWTAASDNVTATSALQYYIYRCSFST